MAIYSNPSDDVVIRQSAAWDEGQDTWIVIARAHALIAAYQILNAAGLGDIRFHRAVDGGFEDVPVRQEIATMMARRPDIDWEFARRDFEGSTAGHPGRPKDRTAADPQRRRRAKQGATRDNRDARP